MVLTGWDVLEVCALVFLARYAWYSPIRVQACSTVFAIAVLHGMARLYIGTYGPGVESAVAVGILASIIGLMHLFFPYTWRGLIVGICFSLVTVASGLAVLGVVPIVYQQGPGGDFWTIVSALLWISWGTVFATVWRSRHVGAQ
jgi:hypothetical protein